MSYRHFTVWHKLTVVRLKEILNFKKMLNLKKRVEKSYCITGEKDKYHFIDVVNLANFL